MKMSSNTVKEQSDLQILYLTKSCTMDCYYCYEKKTRDNSSKMSIDVAKKIIDSALIEIPENILARFLLFGGEPFMNKETLFFVLDYLLEKNNEGRDVLATITTNGSLLSSDIVKKLVKYRPIISMQVSFDGDPETQNKHRKFNGGHDSYDIIAPKIKYLLMHFPFTQCRIVTSEPKDMIKDIKHLVEVIGFKRFCIQSLRINRTNDENDKFLEEFNIYIEDVLEYAKTQYNVKIVEIQKLKHSTLQNREVNTKGKYNYYTPTGDRIMQNMYTTAGFEHFNKGKYASVNLLTRNNKEG